MQIEEIEFGDILCMEIKQIPDSYHHPCFIPSHNYPWCNEVRAIDTSLVAESEILTNLFLT